MIMTMLGSLGTVGHPNGSQYDRTGAAGAPTRGATEQRAAQPFGAKVSWSRRLVAQTVESAKQIAKGNELKRK